MKWKTLSSNEIFKANFVSLNKETCELPDGRIMPSYYVLNFLDWVNVFPVTKQGELIMVKQYRQAAKQTFMEIPGGGLAVGEDPKMGAARELVEETGYEANELKFVASHSPNPALQNNRMHTYLALDCEKKFKQSLDPFEDIEVHLCPLGDVRSLLRTDEFSHSIVLASIYRCLDELNV